MSPKVIKVEYSNEYKLLLEFENREKKIFDVSQFMSIGKFKELHDIQLFKTYRICNGAIEWANEIDLSPDTLYLMSETKN
ncbi:MAG: DUF2442 domain-containing protein [Candidatus Kapabacteria bacterium]|nr:DUF2442 domain-containing protein [Candidatus Kapabacteria bacterium]